MLARNSLQDYVQLDFRVFPIDSALHLLLPRDKSVANVRENRASSKIRGRIRCWSTTRHVERGEHRVLLCCEIVPFSFRSLFRYSTDTGLNAPSVKAYLDFVTFIFSELSQIYRFDALTLSVLRGTDHQLGFLNRVSSRITRATGPSTRSTIPNFLHENSRGTIVSR